MFGLESNTLLGFPYADKEVAQFFAAGDLHVVAESQIRFLYFFDEVFQSIERKISQQDRQVMSPEDFAQNWHTKMNAESLDERSKFYDSAVAKATKKVSLSRQLGMMFHSLNGIYTVSVCQRRLSTTEVYRMER